MGATLSNEEICQMVHPTRDEAIFPRNRSLFGGAGALDRSSWWTTWRADAEYTGSAAPRRLPRARAPCATPPPVRVDEVDIFE